MSSTNNRKLKEGLRILVVEDSPDCASTTAKLLALWGHQAEVATDGKSAIEAACRRPPDVVLLDLGLPDMGGCEVARRLHALRPARPPFIVAVTGHAMEADRVARRHAGIDLFLTKPADPLQLERALERLSEFLLDEQPVG